MNIEQSKYELRKVSDLKNWEDNPRTITDKEFDRLKEQIKLLGLYKPLIVNQNNIVLGGNMRLLALKDLGVEEVMCSIVLTDNTAQMLEYALSDNDQAGTTDEEKVAELVTLHPLKTPDLFSVAVKAPKPISAVLNSVSPSGEDQSRQGKCRQCPEHCGMENI